MAAPGELATDVGTENETYDSPRKDGALTLGPLAIGDDRGTAAVGFPSSA